MTNFPTQLDLWPTISATTAEDDPLAQHDVQHTNLNDAVRALQTKVGIDNSTDTGSLDYKVKNVVADNGLKSGNYGGGAPNFTPTTGAGIAADKDTNKVWIYLNSAWFWTGITLS